MLPPLSQRRHGGDEQPEIELNEIDVRDRDRDVRADDDALVEHAIDQIAEDELLGLIDFFQGRVVAHCDFAPCRSAAPPGSLTKLYGGQGPVKSNASPRCWYARTCAPTAARNSSSRLRSTRNAPLSTSVASGTRAPLASGVSGRWSASRAMARRSSKICFAMRCAAARMAPFPCSAILASSR